MNSFHMVLMILNRSYEKDYVDFLKQQGVVNMTTMLGQGTASKSILDYLGIENNEKVVIQTAVASHKVEPLGMFPVLLNSIPVFNFLDNTPINSSASMYFLFSISSVTPIN